MEGVTAMNDSDDIVKEFLVESYENLDRLDRDLITLEKNPTDRDVLGSIFRTIHTIKGTSGFLNLDKLGAVAHAGESLLGRLRDGELRLDPEITTALLATVDAVRQMLSNIEVMGSEGERDDSDLIARLTRLQHNPANEGGIERESESAPEPAGSQSTPTSAAQAPNIGEILMQRANVSPGEIQKAATMQAEGDPRHLGEILVEQGAARPADVVEALRVQQATPGQSAADRTIDRKSTRLNSSH